MPNLRAEWLGSRSAQLSPMALLLILWQSSAAMVAPYLFSSEALTDSSIRLTWRNSSVETKGYLVFRKTILNSEFVFSSSIPNSSASTCTSSGLLASTQYWHAVKAYSSADTSPLSNALVCTTRALIPVFAAAKVFSDWDKVSNRMKVNFWDSSNCESGHAVYRSVHFGAYGLVGSILSSVPKKTGAQAWIDTGLYVRRGEWYSYMVVTRKAGDSLSSKPDTLFTFDAPSLLTTLTPIYQTEELARFPIRFRSWAMRSGDSLLVSETTFPDTTFSILDISDPRRPAFVGLGHYRPRAADRYRYHAHLGHLYCCADSSRLLKYNYQEGTLRIADSLSLWGMGFVPMFMPLASSFNDSTLLLTQTNKMIVRIGCGSDTLKIAGAGVDWGWFYNDMHFGCDMEPYQKNTVSLGPLVISTASGYGRDPGTMARLCWRRTRILDLGTSDSAPKRFEISPERCYFGKSWFSRSFESVYKEAVLLRTGNVLAGKYVLQDSTKWGYNSVMIDTSSKQMILVYDTLICILGYSLQPSSARAGQCRFVPRNANRQFVICFSDGRRQPD